MDLKLGQLKNELQNVEDKLEQLGSQLGSQRRTYEFIRLEGQKNSLEIKIDNIKTIDKKTKEFEDF